MIASSCCAIDDGAAFFSTTMLFALPSWVNSMALKLEAAGSSLDELAAREGGDVAHERLAAIAKARGP